jgi:hypothetical protein
VAPAQLGLQPGSPLHLASEHPSADVDYVGERIIKHLMGEVEDFDEPPPERFQTSPLRE